MFDKLFGKIETSEYDLALRGQRIPIQTLPSKRALAAWTERRRQFNATRRWPVLVGPAEELDHLESIEDVTEEFERSPREVIAGCTSVDVRMFFNERLEQWESDYGQDEEEPLPVDFDTSQLKLGRDFVPRLSTVYGVGRKPARATGIVEVPCEEPWQIVAHRPFGNWNEVPTDDELTAVLQSWHLSHGAVVLGMTHDVLELWIDQPVRDREIAKSLAVDMYALCPDVVDQGVETIQNLAQSLLGNHVWYFWWD